MTPAALALIATAIDRRPLSPGDACDDSSSGDAGD
jgi:hypothetical protein